MEPSPLPRRSVLPFVGGTPAVVPPANPGQGPSVSGLPFVPEVEVSTAVEPSPIPRRPVLPFAGGTVAPEVTPGPRAGGSAAGLPFVPAAGATPARSAGLTLEQYAWITARLQAEPSKLGEVLTQVGITGEEEWTLHAVSWERRLASDPISRARWAEMVRYYRGRAG